MLILPSSGRDPFDASKVTVELRKLTVTAMTRRQAEEVYSEVQASCKTWMQKEGEKTKRKKLEKVSFMRNLTYRWTWETVKNKFLNW